MHSSISEADTTPSQASSAQSSSEASNSDRPEGSFPDASRLVSLPAPSTARIQESASVEPSPSAPMSEDAPALQENPGPARANPDEVSGTPAPVGLCGTSNDVNPQETESPSTEVSPILPSAVEHSPSSLADTSEKK